MNDNRGAIAKVILLSVVLMATLELPATASGRTNAWLGEQGPSGSALHGSQAEQAPPSSDWNIACPQNNGDTNWIRWYVRAEQTDGDFMEIGTSYELSRSNGSCTFTTIYNYTQETVDFTGSLIPIGGPVGVIDGSNHLYAENRIDFPLGLYEWESRIDGTDYADCCSTTEQAQIAKAGERCWREATGTACPSNSVMSSISRQLKVKRADNNNWIDWSDPFGHCVEHSQGGDGNWYSGHTEIRTGFNESFSSFTDCPGF